MKYSKQRECILNVVCNCSNHPTADFIYQMAQKVFPSISLGTVYRNLNQLCIEGKIQKIFMPDLKDHYDQTVMNHTHFFCTRCQSIYDIFDDSFIIDLKKMEQQGYQIDACNFILIGICKDCR